MNSTTITIGLVAVALAVGAWILLRGGREEDEEDAVAAPSAPPAPSPPVAAARGTTSGSSSSAVGTAPPRPPMTATPPMSAPMSSAPFAAAPVSGYGGFLTNAPMTTEAHAYEVRTRWQELQLRFVDDPQTAAGEAERLIDDALAGVTASLHARRDQLSAWRSSGRDDTEQLRAAVHGYRDFLNHLVGA